MPGKGALSKKSGKKNEEHKLVKFPTKIQKEDSGLSLSLNLP